jgi:predicted phosphohydrolase
MRKKNKMILQYCSDLHLEFSQNRKFITKYPLAPKGDVLLLAGDIVPFTLIDEHADFFNFVADNFKQTYWVPGNHEYYHGDIKNKSGKINEAIRSNVFLVNNDTVQLDNVRFIFSTLWSNISPANYIAIQNRMADFSAIKNGDRAFTPDIFNELHLQCKNFITKTLTDKTDSPTIVVTHHIPTFLHYPAKYKRDVLNEAFAVELFDLIEQSTIDYWMYGHHHFNVPDFVIGKTQLLTNQLGYIKYKENDGFRNDAVIEIV